MSQPFTSKDRAFLRQGAGEAAAMLRTLGHEQRLLVLCLLIGHGELNVSQLLEQVELSQSALSQHLARMRADGLVDCRREGQAVYYRIADPRVATLVGALKSVFCP
ncbi:metalloregulator ArsR/SmtB family transcription factor [Pseudoxanthomonas sp. J35]|uniref:ArsR/SmtB family transcription factor n=1 Tax=Pseudoxanthomonas sp. J35 TaxID=935852 RepID=UPI00048D7718|nr:metalloregulator ArsR/SmtB family transcription factor [Pseudoxanthomonas sp. J35]